MLQDSKSFVMAFSFTVSLKKLWYVFISYPSLLLLLLLLLFPSLSLSPSLSP